MDAVCVTVRVLGCCQLTMLINVLGAREGHVQRAHWTCCGSASIIIVYMYKSVASSFSEGEGVLLAFAWSGADGTADGEVAPARKD